MNSGHEGQSFSSATYHPASFVLAPCRDKRALHEQRPAEPAAVTSRWRFGSGFYCGSFGSGSRWKSTWRACPTGRFLGPIAPGPSLAPPRTAGGVTAGVARELDDSEVAESYMDAKQVRGRGC